MRWMNMMTILGTKRNDHLRRRDARPTRRRTTGRRLLFESLECKAMLNAAPVATDDSYTVDEDSSFNANVLDNDLGVGLEVIKLNGVTFPGSATLGESALGASVTLFSTGKLVYSAFESEILNELALGETAVDTFTYTISDGNGNTDMATVFVTVTGKSDATLSGLVYFDVNNDGEVDITDQPIEGVTVELLDSSGSVVESTVTDADGAYFFVEVAEGTYTIREIQPSGVVDGIDSEGTLGGDAVSINDRISGIVVEQTDGENYNFGEQGQAIEGGDTATIGFWQNKNGQNLIKTVSNDTQLGYWLASEFPNMFDDLADSDNDGVALEYQRLFKLKHQKLDAQVMATALSVYVTSSNLSDGTVAAAYGFTVTETGIGTKLFNVGDSGEAFDVADNTNLTIMQLLQATDDKTSSESGELYDLDDDFFIDDDGAVSEQLLRNLANEIYTAINEQGDI